MPTMATPDGTERPWPMTPIAASVQSCSEAFHSSGGGEVLGAEETPRVRGARGRRARCVGRPGIDCRTPGVAERRGSSHSEAEARGGREVRGTGGQPATVGEVGDADGTPARPRGGGGGANGARKSAGRDHDKKGSHKTCVSFHIDVRWCAAGWPRWAHPSCRTLQPLRPSSRAAACSSTCK